MLVARGLSTLRNGRGDKPCEVVVVTATPRGEFDDETLPFPVERRPGLLRLWRRIGEADLVHLAGPAFVPLVLGLLRGKRVVVEHHGYQAVCPNGLLFYQPSQTACPGHFMAQRYLHCLRCNATAFGPVKSLLMLTATFPRRWLCKRVGANAPITRHVQMRLQLPRSTVVYYGVIDPGPSGSPGPFPLGPQPRGGAGVTFGYVGRLVTEKGVACLIQAAGRLRDAQPAFRLKIVGDGPERAELERMAIELGVAARVSFTGFLTGDTLQEELGDIAVVVMPTLMEETAGLAAIEHMMRGRLVIAAEVGGLAEVVGEAGLKFPPGDVEALAERMNWVLQHPELVAEIGTLARTRALRLFRQERMVQTHLELFEKLTPAK